MMTRTQQRQQRNMRRVLAVAYLVLITVAVIVGAYAGGRTGATDAVRHELVTTQPNPEQRWLDGCTTDADCAAMQEAIDALTGPDYGTVPEQSHPVTAELADALAEGDDTPPESASTRDWLACEYTGEVGSTITVTCPDGFVTTQ